MSHVDIIARGIALAGLVVATASLLLTWQLWKRSGGELDATLDGIVGHGFADWPPEKVIFTVDVINKGRMTATVRSVVVLPFDTRWKHVRWLSWWYRLTRRSGSIGYTAYPVEKGDRLGQEDVESRYPQEIPPTGYLKVSTHIDADLIKRRHRWAQAVVIRGDHRRSYSRRIPMPRPERETSQSRRSR